MMVSKSNSNCQESNKNVKNVKKEVNPLYKITSVDFLESLYLLIKQYKKHSPKNLTKNENEKKIFEFNCSQIKLFFENIFRIKFTNICKPAIKMFLEKYQPKRISQRLKKIDLSKIKNLEKDNLSHKVPDPSCIDNNLSLNLLKSVEQHNAQNLISDYLNTKKRIFQESIRIKTEFTSPELTGSQAFQKIQLTTIKKSKFLN